LDHDQQTRQGFEPVPDEDDMFVGTADPGDDSDAPVQLDAAEPASSGRAGTAENVRGDVVTLTQGSAQSIEAATVNISQGGAARVSADEVSVHQGGVAVARAGHLTVQSEASAFAVVADNATVDEGANVFVLISRNVSGAVRPVLDWRSALALGGGAALVMSILRRLR
jgi:hypothetical protein